MFDASFFVANRQRLYSQLGTKGFVVMTAHMLMQRSADLAFHFAQEPNFWYLTGINEPDWLLIADLTTKQEWLVAPQLSEVQIAFDGSLLPDEASKTSGISTVLDKKAGLTLLKKISHTSLQVFGLQPYRGRHYNAAPNPAQKILKQRLKGVEFTDIRLHLARMRAIKQPLEITAIQKSIDITAAGLQAVYDALPQLQYEYQAAAILDYEFRFRGAMHAFEPTIAAGQNSCMFHYDAKTGSLAKGLLLFDIGARADHYAADVGRVVALNVPTNREQAIFEAVARAQQEIISLLHAGKSVKEYLEQVQEIMLRELQGLHLLPNTAKPRDIYTNMQHAISHGLGIDVHDSLGQPKVFAENMVIMVEPGIYDRAAACGVRLEDGILITKTGTKNLSKAIPIGLKAG